MARLAVVALALLMAARTSGLRNGAALTPPMGFANWCVRAGGGGVSARSATAGRSAVAAVPGASFDS